MSVSVSPLAPKSYADMPAIRGVRMATASAGIKYKNRTDVLMMVFDRPASVAGVFTRSKCPSSPVDFCRANLPGGVARAVVVNSGNALMLFATGAAAADGQQRVVDAADPALEAFRAALADLLRDLALQVVRDGEGARKMVEITVEGAESDAAAKVIALSIANSPLVKTAVAGEDANWGRVVMAVGKSGEMADRDRLAIWFGHVRVAVDGERDPDYSEAEASAVMKEEDIPIRVDIGLGNGRATVWTCDLTKAYVEINGDYRS